MQPSASNQSGMCSGSQIDKGARLEAAIREMTRPINGQYPRPWMTSLTNPTSARVFTVGKNQRNGFDVEAVGSHEHYMNALFNRGSETCRQLYDRLTQKPSPTRCNTDALVAALGQHAVTDIVETNVICYSTPMSVDLRLTAHEGGADRGRELFRALLEIIRPQVLVAHGSDTAKELGTVLDHPLPPPPDEPGKPLEVTVDGTVVFVIPSLAPPAYNKWVRWAPEHLEKVAGRVAELLRSS